MPSIVLSIIALLVSLFSLIAVLKSYPKIIHLKPKKEDKPSLNEYLAANKDRSLYTKEDLFGFGYSEFEVNKILKLDLKDQFAYFGYTQKQVDKMYDENEF